MSNVFSTAFNTLFQDGNMAVECVYAPLVGDAFTVRALEVQPDASGGPFSVGAWQEGIVLEVRVSELSAPKEGDSITFMGVSHRIRSVKKEYDRMVWRVNLV